MSIAVQATIVILVLGIVALLGIILGVKLLPKMKQKQGYPHEEEIEAVLYPFLYRAICAAYRVEEWSMDELDTTLDGVDKKKFADMTYSLLPDVIGGFSVMLIKTLVPLPKWELLVQNVFDGFDAWFVTYQAKFEEEFEKWAQANAPEEEPVPDPITYQLQPA